MRSNSIRLSSLKVRHHVQQMKYLSERSVRVRVSTGFFLLWQIGCLSMR